MEYLVRGSSNMKDEGSVHSRILLHVRTSEPRPRRRVSDDGEYQQKS